MRPAARLQSAIELLDGIIMAARDNGPSADQLAKRFFAERRYAGSKDRRAVRDLAWAAIRRFGERPESARAAFVAMAENDAELAALFDGSDYGPAAIGATEPRATGALLPQWLLPHFAELMDANERQALLDRAPLDLRVNALKASREAVAAEFPDAEILHQSPYALRLPTGLAIDSHAAVQEGRVEIQDLGSQLIIDATAARPGMSVLDLCAGAGGKTLGLAAYMDGKGRLIASDTNRARLDQMKPRANRAGALEVEARLLNPGRERSMLADLNGACAVVLVDAPCSGSGTWRRNPETRWRLTPARLAQVIQAQANLLSIASEMVAPGGHLVYAVCSLLEEEGRGQVERFLQSHDGWRPDNISLPAGRKYGDGILLTPHHDGTDGFFLARLQKL
ncbi:MAG: RsmB/NOP family class I SAM-dependent RNA methyltransferase [Sphingorhabdus sp.]